MPITTCAYGVQHSNPTQPSFPFALIITVNEHPLISKGSKKVFLTTMKKPTKKSPKEVDRSNSPSRPGSSGGLKSELETFFNKFLNKLSSKPPSRSTSPFPSTSTENPGGGTVIGKYTISSAGIRSIIPSQIPQRLRLRVLRLRCHLIAQGLIAHCQHRHYRLLRKWFKVSDLATHRYSSD